MELVIGIRWNGLPLLISGGECCAAESQLDINPKPYSLCIALWTLSPTLPGPAQHQSSADVCWARVFTSETQLQHIRNFADLAKIALTTPTGSVENEGSFSLMNYVNNERRNRMGPEVLNAICRIKRSGYTIKVFPYEETIRVWKESRPRRGL